VFRQESNIYVGTVTFLAETDSQRQQVDWCSQHLFWSSQIVRVFAYWFLHVVERAIAVVELIIAPSMCRKTSHGIARRNDNVISDN